MSVSPSPFAPHLTCLYAQSVPRPATPAHQAHYLVKAFPPSQRPPAYADPTDVCTTVRILDCIPTSACPTQLPSSPTPSDLTPPGHVPNAPEHLSQWTTLRKPEKRKKHSFPRRSTLSTAGCPTRLTAPTILMPNSSAGTEGNSGDDDHTVCLHVDDEDEDDMDEGDEYDMKAKRLAARMSQVHLTSSRYVQTRWISFHHQS